MSSANNSKLTVSELDFDSIKQNLLDYLKSQDAFKDYDFTGSALNQLLNILAYNTHYLAFYLNMVANEMFLDTAVLANNIISHAKLMGYVPRSMTASQAVVNVAITKANTDSTTILTLPRFTPFTSEPLDGVSYNFVTVDSYTVSNTNSVFNFAGVVVKEGQPVTKTFIVDSLTNPNQVFDLGDATIDTSTLQVIVQTSNTNLSQNTFTLATDATQVDGKTNVFYLDVSQSGSYQIYFGDGILGAQLDDGNLVIVSYISTSGNAANGLETFRLQTSLLSGSTSNVTTQIASTAGSAAESTDSIKFNAPKSYLSQNRAVTIDDYVNLINQKYPFFQAVTVWGGEQNNPPVYGKVFISALPLAGFSITEAEKQFVTKQVIQPVSILTVLPEFVDADLNFLNFRVNVYYNPTETTSTSGEISTIVTGAVGTWANNNLNQFNNTFRLSKLLRAIDDSDPSVTSSTCDIFVEKRFNPTMNIATTYTLNYGMPLKVGTGSERLYSTPTFTQEDTSGISRQCYIEEVPQSSTGLQAVTINNPGSGYITPPTLLVEGDGQGANAYAVIVNGKVQSVVVDKPGSEYTSAVVQVLGGAGSGAVLTAVIQGSTGNLRSFYFDQNNVKTVMDDNVGTIDYVNGIITLTNFAPINVANPQGTLSIHAQPLNDNFTSNLNRIITFDTTDLSAISVTVNVDTGN